MKRYLYILVAIFFLGGISCGNMNPYYLCEAPPCDDSVDVGLEAEPEPEPTLEEVTVELIRVDLGNPYLEVEIREAWDDPTYSDVQSKSSGDIINREFTRNLERSKTLVRFSVNPDDNEDIGFEDLPTNQDASYDYEIEARAIRMERNAKIVGSTQRLAIRTDHFDMDYSEDGDRETATKGVIIGDRVDGSGTVIDRMTRLEVDTLRVEAVFFKARELSRIMARGPRTFEMAASRADLEEGRIEAPVARIYGGEVNMRADIEFGDECEIKAFRPTFEEPTRKALGEAEEGDRTGRSDRVTQLGLLTFDAAASGTGTMRMVSDDGRVILGSGTIIAVSTLKIEAGTREPASGTKTMETSDRVELPSITLSGTLNVSRLELRTLGEISAERCMLPVGTECRLNDEARPDCFGCGVIGGDDDDDSVSRE